MASIAFIDLEASGLGSDSWPIEVGWCFQGEPPEGFLIRPAPDWPQESWDENAQNLHGIDREELASKGADPGEICRKLNAALGAATVYSDAPDWDGFWLMRLFQAGAIKQEFPLRDFNKIFNDMTRREIDGFIARAAEISPHRHRVKDDVLHMREIYKLVRAAALDN